MRTGEPLDCAIVGAGVSGLAAAALLARAGRRVVVFEQGAAPGGLLRGAWDDAASAPLLVGGWGPGGWCRAVLEEAGAWEGELSRESSAANPVYRLLLPGCEVVVPADPERYRQELCALWPAEAEGIRGFFTEMAELGAAYPALGEGAAPEGRLQRRHGLPLATLLDDHTREPATRTALSALWLLAGLPPRRLSALHYAFLWYGVHHQGVARLPRGAGPLATALEAALLRAGGSVEYDTPVHRILRRRGAVSGVRVGPPGAARDVPARAVLSTASPAVTFEELLHAEGEAPAGYPPLRTGFVTALSALLVRAPLAHLPSAPHCPVLYHGGSDPEEAGWDLQRSRPEMLALALSLLPAAGGNPAQAVIYAPAPYSRPDFWEAPLESRPGGEYRSLAGYRQLKAELGAILLARAATALPELRGAAVPPEAVATPLTLERRTGNTGGSCWGWAPLPEQCGVHRPGPRTPFQGLFMAGQWTFPGGCVAGALLSARSAARAMLAHLGGDPATSGRPTGYHPQ